VIRYQTPALSVSLLGRIDIHKTHLYLKDNTEYIQVTGMKSRAKSLSIGFIFCFLCVSCVSICIAQDFPLESEATDCADLVTAGQNDVAFGCFGRAIEADPSSAFDWAGQGDVMNNIGFYYQALVYYEMALNLKPDSSNILTSKGRTLTRLGKYDEALDILAQALDHDPENTYTWESIGDVYTELGDTDKADAAYARAEPAKTAKPATQRKTVEDYLAGGSKVASSQEEGL
jgi:tetratricopeptide (TPR) repeat protein